METAQQMAQRHWRERQELEAAERAAAREAMAREREERAAAELRENQAAVEKRIASAAADLPALLNEIAKAGISLSLDGDTILATPSGGLNLIWQRAIQAKRSAVVELLKQRYAVQRL